MLPPDQKAIFNAARDAIEDDAVTRRVPRSFRAALLAGVVVGCCLAGLDATHAGATLRALSGGLISEAAAPRLVPVVIVLGLYGGARAAATSLLIAHAVLHRLGVTAHSAYACGGAVVAGALSYATALAAQAGWLDAGLLPSHGLAVDIVAGAGAGFFYRVFAGATRSPA